ncbi:MAG: hypothetical protein JSS69_18770 [Acidobacteria bacterium]|nr:hypothetical protein [Acidobacteriota bacterium]
MAKNAGLVRHFKWAGGWAEAIAFGGAVGTGVGTSLVIDRYVPGMPLWGGAPLVEAAAEGVGLTLREGISYTVKVIGTSKWALRGLATRGKWFSGRLFSFDGMG